MKGLALKVDWVVDRRDENTKGKKEIHNIDIFLKEMALQTFEMHKLSELWKLFPPGPRPAFPPCSATLLFYSFISNNRDFFFKKMLPSLILQTRNVPSTAICLPAE